MHPKSFWSTAAFSKISQNIREGEKKTGFYWFVLLKTSRSRKSTEVFYFYPCFCKKKNSSRLLCRYREACSRPSSFLKTKAKLLHFATDGEMYILRDAEKMNKKAGRNNNIGKRGTESSFTLGAVCHKIEKCKREKKPEFGF